MQITDNPFRMPLRVYYEDTDAGGVVYYANYLAFMERARTEWLRSLGYENQQLLDEQGVVFAVRRAAVDYISPARLDDLLEVVVSLSRIKRASLVFEQQILRGDELLCKGEIMLVCVGLEDFKPTAIPDSIMQEINNDR
ncbi:MAG: tol-pal system-associated acyl-CoA thioesterase [Chromatiales bacterium]